MCARRSSCAFSGPISRRVLLRTTGTAAAGGLLLRGTQAGEVALPRLAEAAGPEVRVAFIRPEGEYWLGWPGTAWDVEGFMTKAREKAEQFAGKLGVRLTFEPKPLYDDAAVDQFIASVQAQKPNGVLLFPLHMQAWQAVDKIAQAGSPTVIFAPLGVGFTQHIATVARRPGVYLASCADFDMAPVRFGLKLIRTAFDMHRMKIAVIRNQPLAKAEGSEAEEQVLEPLGLTIRRVPRERFPEVLATIETDGQVRAVADEYRKAAKGTVEPSDEDLINAAKNYIVALKIMKDEGCQGITMDCLGLVRDRQIPCPPCMAWSKLLDVGIPGVCEADINAVMSHALCCNLLDKPGFQQDPVPNTVRNTLIGAHCVSPTRLNGYDQPREPFVLRSHSESDIGVSLQVIWRPGQEVTVMQFMGAGKMILGKGKVLRNFDTPPAGGCRTSVELELDGPPDTRDTKGFHQLFIYGDHVRDFQAYGQMHGIETEPI